jgi:hypothetical protein
MTHGKTMDISVVFAQVKFEFWLWTTLNQGADWRTKNVFAESIGSIYYSKGRQVNPTGQNQPR